MNETLARNPQGHMFDAESLSKLKNKLSKFPICRDSAHEDIPWKDDAKVYEPGTIGLHNEIKDFYNYIKPTEEEQYAREIVVAKIKDVVRSMWPDCEVDVFGSFKTGLYLPTSDIDMVIFGKWEALPLHTLKNALSSSNISSEITVLDKATVPIVKMTDKDTGLKVDISFNMINSVRAAVLIQDYIKTFPCLPYLVFVLKQFLLQRNLNEVWTGGLSSYALILMVVRFLQDTISSRWASENVNLGTLLLEFFELYGRLFNYSKTAIRVTDRGEYVQKEVVLQNMVHSIRPSILCIEDPLCPGNDVGRRSYQAMLVKQAFEYAYLVLSSAVLPHYDFLHSGKETSILGRIIRISKESVECRQRIRAYGRNLLDSLKLHQQPVGPTHKPIIMAVQPASTMSLLPMNWHAHRPAFALPANLPMLIPNPASMPHIQIPMPSGMQNNAPLPSHPVLSTIHTQQPIVQYPVPHPTETQIPAANKQTSPAKHTDVSKDESSNSDLSNPEESPVPTPSTTEDVVNEKFERSEKPGEYSVLAEELASLSTLLSTDSAGGPSKDFSGSVVDHEDSKRRCLRPTSASCDCTETTACPAKANSTQDNQSLQCPSDIHSRNSSNKLDESESATSANTGFGRSRKHLSKSARQAARLQVDQRAPQFPKLVNVSSSTSNSLSFGQKRHAPSARRAK